jgi:phage repressor protein C with HTH and peptisase S24 domain
MVNKISTIKERVVSLIENEKVAKEVFFNKIGVTSANFRGKAKDTPLNSTAIANIYAEFPNISLEWLLTGVGKMYRNDENYEQQESSSMGQGSRSARDRFIHRDKNEDYRLVPLISIDLIGKDMAINKSRPHLKKVPFLGAEEKDICFTIIGSSMLPTYQPGSIALAREVENWRDYFGYGEIYCILLTDGRKILREVRKYEANPKDYILCVAHSEAIAAEELPRDMISRVWKIVQVLLPENW